MAVEQPEPVGTDRQGPGPFGKDSELERLLPRGHVPDLQGAVLAAGGEAPVAVEEDQIGHQTRMRVQGMDLLPGVRLPDLDRSVLAAQRYEPAVAAERRH